MRSIFAVLLACSLPCAAHAADWHPFRWYMASIGGGPVERVAMLLPVKVNGVDCRVQLDTAVGQELIWTRQSPAVQPQQPAASAQPALIELAGIRKSVSAQAANLEPLTAENCSAGTIATVGSAFFEHGTLTLDLGRARFAFAASARLADEPAARPFRYTRLAEGGGPPLVELKRPGGKTGYAVLDTGSARFDLAALTRQQWDDLSGGLPPEAGPKVRAFSVPSWGRQLPCYETMLDGGFEVGGASVPQANVSYCIDEGFRPPADTLGVLGMRPFGDRVITLDFLSQRWRLSDRPSSSGL
ncbi:hypothetical protein NHH73_14055 [Oxalobacteraceae bacterium OTU3CINTB1]|nr:hypothetical protein NHH73_14055 [Oxalobacteraceae bacterium OTU3CINTB1]